MDSWDKAELRRAEDEEAWEWCAEQALDEGCGCGRSWTAAELADQDRICEECGDSVNRVAEALYTTER